MCRMNSKGSNHWLCNMLLVVACHVQPQEHLDLFVTKVMHQCSTKPIKLTSFHYLWQNHFVHSNSRVCATKSPEREMLAIPTIFRLLQKQVKYKILAGNYIPSRNTQHSGMVGIGCRIMPRISDYPLHIRCLVTSNIGT